MVQADCVFCDVRKIQSEVEFMYGADSSEHFVFEPLDPVKPGHLLVVPAAHVESATEEPLVTAMAAGVAARVAQRYHAANIITSIGRAATQSVFHLYWHVVPRTYGDRLALPWTKQLRREGVVGVGLRKFGEGEVIAESEQQKVAAKQGMTEQDRRELQEENEQADGPGGD